MECPLLVILLGNWSVQLSFDVMSTDLHLLQLALWCVAVACHHQMAPGPAQVPGLVDVNDVEQDMGDVPIDPALLVVPGPPAPTAANQQMLTNVIQNLQGKP